jgi:biotin carboxylase
MAKKRLLILGAGVMQGPAIKTAKDLGLEAVVVDGDPNAPLAAEADRFEQVDLKDRLKIEAFAKVLQSEEGALAGVMTAGTDFSASVAWTAEKLGLPGISYETALDASDKERMRERFKEHDVPSPAFTVFSGELESPESVPFPFPVVVKPVDNMGGRGCRRVDASAELAEAVESARQFSRSGRVIVEEYMEGPEFSIDAIVYRGDITLCGIADRHIFFPPYFIEMGHTMPTAFSEQDQAALVDVFIRGIRALGIDNGAAKGDIKLTKRGPMIGEIAARLSGGYMSGWTYPLASGVNPAGGAISVALGEKPGNLTPARQWTSAERAFISIPGIVNSIEGIDAARAIPGVKELFLRAQPGGKAVFPENNVSKAGNVISAAPARKEAVEAAENAARVVLIRLKAPNAETGAFLNGPLTAEAFPPPAFTLDSALLERLAVIPQNSMQRRKNTDKALPDISLNPFPAFMESGLTDYLGRSPRQTLDVVRRLTGLPLPLSATSGGDGVFGREFWTALARGGYQGAVYHIDSLFNGTFYANKGGK